MNVIVSNKQKNIIDNANIDAIKDLNGLFNVDDLISKFNNYYFSKMILDATSIVDFASKPVLEKLASGIGPERLIILLPSSPEPPKEFVNLLLSLKIYNFSTKIEDVVKFLDNPNTYDNVIQNTGVVSNNNFYVDNSIKSNDVYTEENNLNGVPLVDNTNNQLSNNENVNLENDYQLQDDNIDLNSTSYHEEINNKQENDIANMPMNETISNNDVDEKLNNSLNNNFYGNNIINNEQEVRNSINYNQITNKKVLAFRNVTLHAGSTTIIYLLMKMLRDKYNKRVLALEVNKNDFKYYQNDKMISTNSDQLLNMITNNNSEVVLIDLNDYQGNFDFINEVIYLVEPSIIKLNMLMMNNRFAFRELQGKKVILNMSFLSTSDVHAFSKEAGMDMFMNIPPLNDRISNSIIDKLIEMLDIN